LSFLPFSCIYQAFNAAVARFPDNPALIYLGKEFTYSQLKDLVERIAASLNHLGVEKGDRAIIYLTTTPQWIISWLSLLRIGAVAVPITPIYTPYDIRYLANDSRAETIFCMDTNFGYVTQVLRETSLKRVIVTNAVELLPWWKKLTGKAFDKIPEGKFTLGENIFTFGSLLKRGLPPPPNFTVEGKEIAEILYTGGTLGPPKGVPIPHICFVEDIIEARKTSEALIPRGEDIVVLGSPPYHMLGQERGLGALLHGDALLLLPRINLDGLFDHIQSYKVTTFFGVPAIFRMILEHDRVDYYDLSSVRYYLCAGDLLPTEVADRWLEKFGKTIYTGYGATETSGGVTLTFAGEPFPKSSAGKIAHFRKVKLVYPDTLEEVQPGEPGEILVSSENMVTGYWNKPEETAESFANIDGRLWYRTKDILRIDNDGWVFFSDRSADMIKHKGYRVAASKIEAVLQEHQAVVASCVVGIPDVMVGERIKAFVVLKEDIKGVSAYELIAWCRERLPSHEVPQYIEFRDMLPKSKVGKVLRREVRAEERRKLEKSSLRGEEN